MSPAGERLSVLRVPNEAPAIANAMADAGPEPKVVIEATYGWYWVVDLLQDLGATVHLANPKALNWGDRRVKNDVADATDLADMLRLNRLPEAWIAPPAIRELRELVRYRAKLVKLRSGLKSQVHAVMAKEGVLPRAADIFCTKGNAQLDAWSSVPTTRCGSSPCAISSPSTTARSSCSSARSTNTSDAIRGTGRSR
jgi:transposase